LSSSPRWRKARVPAGDHALISLPAKAAGDALRSDGLHICSAELPGGNPRSGGLHGGAIRSAGLHGGNLRSGTLHGGALRSDGLPLLLRLFALSPLALHLPIERSARTGHPTMPAIEAACSDKTCNTSVCGFASSRRFISYSHKSPRGKAAAPA
jgi:hypothetical protein